MKATTPTIQRVKDERSIRFSRLRSLVFGLWFLVLCSQQSNQRSKTKSQRPSSKKKRPLLAAFYPALMLAEPIVMPISIVLSYGSAFLFGIPLMLICHRRGVRQWWLYLLGGIACSLPTIVLYALAPLPDYLMPFGLMPALAVLFWGASSGGVFWMIGVATVSPLRRLSSISPASRPIS